jgi:hypothetical protein
MKNVLFSLVAGVLFIAAIKVYGQQAEAPVYKDGDCWEFRSSETGFIYSSSDALSGDYGVCHSGGDLKVFEMGKDGQRTLELTSEAGEILKTMLGKGSYLAGGRYALQFPLFVGKKWSFSYNYRNPGAKKPLYRNAEVGVITEEKIDTPAGTFRAFQLVYEDSPGPKGKWKFTYHYSPETKSIIKYFFDFSEGGAMQGKREVVLVRYRPSQ